MISYSCSLDFNLLLYFFIQVSMCTSNLISIALICFLRVSSNSIYFPISSSNSSSGLEYSVFVYIFTNKFSPMEIFSNFF